jgi:hypothetical protein
MVEDYVDGKVAAAEKKVCHIIVWSCCRCLPKLLLQVEIMLPRIRKILDGWRNACLLRVFEAWHSWSLVTRIERLQAAAAASRAEKFVL